MGNVSVRSHSTTSPAPARSRDGPAAALSYATPGIDVLLRPIAATPAQPQDVHKPGIGASALRKRAFAGGLLRRERLRLTLGVRDGALATGEPGEAGGEDEGE
jgi:hypothetical protein